MQVETKKAFHFSVKNMHKLNSAFMQNVSAKSFVMWLLGVILLQFGVMIILERN